MADEPEAGPDESADDADERRENATPDSEAEPADDTGRADRIDDTDDTDTDDAEYAPDPSVPTDTEADDDATDSGAIDGDVTDGSAGDEDAVADPAMDPDAIDEAVDDASPPPDSAAGETEETVRKLEEAYDLDPVDDADAPGDGADDPAEVRGADAETDPDEDLEPTAADGEPVPAPAADAGVTATDGAVAADAPELDDDDFLDSGLVGEGPESDREMPLAAHIEEMVRRLGIVLAVGGTVMLLLYPGGDLLNHLAGTNLTSASDVINFLWNAHIPGAPEIADRRPRLYGPLELILTELKVAGLAGFVVGLPVLVYQTFRFMRPGLYPNERRYYLAAVPTSLVLALVGIAFAHFVVLPAIFAYFTSYTQGTAVIAFGLRETFNLILILMGYMAIVFQIPLFIMLGIMMGLFTRQWLSEKRLLFWGGFLGLAFLVSPDPTGMAPIIVAVTMITLFEGTLALLKWTGN